MKIAKLVLGIICIVYSVFIFIQTGIYDITDYIGEGLHAAFSTGDVHVQSLILVKSGYLVSCFMLAGGITSIAARKSYGGAMACLILFGLAGVTAYSGLVGYLLEYRVIPACFCFAMAIFFGVSLFAQKYDADVTTIEDVNNQEETDIP